MTNYEQVNDSTQFSRRTFLKMLGIGGAGVAIGASGVVVFGLSNRCLIHLKTQKRMHMNFMVKCNQALPHPRKNMQFRCVRFEVKR